MIWPGSCGDWDTVEKEIEMSKRTVAKIVVITVVGAILGGCARDLVMINQYVDSERQISVIHLAMQSVVKVVSAQYPDYPASGFYIGDGIVVTAGHVSEADHITSVKFEDGVVCEVLERITHPNFDCGFLLIAPVDKPELKFDSALIKRGLVVMTLGNPTIDELHFEFLATKGIVTGFSDVDRYFGDILLFISDSVAHGGNSGSVVIDADGEIRGMYVGGKRNRLGIMIHGAEMNIQATDILDALIAAGLREQPPRRKRVLLRG